MADNSVYQFNVTQRAKETIDKLQPRKAHRLNEVTHRFSIQKERHQLLNSAVQDPTQKQPVPTLTQGAINL